MLKIAEYQTFSFKISGSPVMLRFFNPKKISIPSFQPFVTSLGIDTNKLLTPDDLEKIRLNFNKIIRAYRLVTKETYNSGNIIQIPKDQFFKFIRYGNIAKNGSISGKRSIQHITMLEIGFVSAASYAKIKKLTSSINLLKNYYNDEILLQAKSFLQQENYRMSVLEAVIALEIAVSAIISKQGENKISESDVKSLLSRTGLHSCFDILLRLLIPEDLPSEDILSGCKKAITIRNGIVHKARSSVNKNEAQEALDNIEKFVNRVRLIVE